MNSNLLKRLAAIFISSLAVLPLPAAELPAWFVGVAKIDVTPDFPVRLSGYGSRRAEFEGVTQRIFAKAIAIGSDADAPAVLLTVDNCGVPASMRDELVKRLATKTKVANQRVAICSSHTHCAPMLRRCRTESLQHQYSTRPFGTD